MKNTINTLTLLLFLGAVAFTTLSCNSKSSENSASGNEIHIDNNEFDGVKAYYFHATRRCATCQAVEDISKEVINEYYADKVHFESINRDEEKDKPLINKYQVSGQTLLIVNGDKIVNLTNEAFLNARTNPEKFKDKLKSTIDSMM